MSKKSVAVLDIRSAQITAVIGEAGVNNTFVFKGTANELYDGYESGKFYDEKGLKQAIYSVLNECGQSAGEKHSTLYVSVPGEFTKIVNSKKLIAFSSPKRIKKTDVETLYKEGYLDVEREGYENISSSALYFITSDGRKLVDPTGLISGTLQANVTYVLCSVYFTQTLRKILKDYGIKNIEFLPSTMVQAQYLLTESVRKESAVLLDVGMVSSTVSIVYGNGILQAKTLPIGEGNILLALCEAFEWEYEKAVYELKKANLFRRSVPENRPLYPDEKYVEPEKINEVIVQELDGLCGPLSVFLDECNYLAPTRPVLITGEGITSIRGAIEHISKRVSRDVQVVAPHLPYYNKPNMSSKIALLSKALQEDKKETYIDKLLNLFNRIGG